MTLRREVLAGGAAVVTGVVYGLPRLSESGPGGGGGGELPDPPNWLTVPAGETYTVNDGDSQEYSGWSNQIQATLTIEAGGEITVTGAS